MKKIALSLLMGISGISAIAQTYHVLFSDNFTQNWTNPALITANDDWSGVLSMQGFLGDYTGSAPTGVDPQTILVDMSTIDVIANQSSPNTLSTGGVAEFDGITDRTIALTGSGTADAPNIVLYINTSGVTGVRIKYNVRDIDGSADDAVQQVALQYRTGNTGNFINVPGGYVADATTGPGLATLVTPVNVLLPGSCDNQSQLQIRIITSNAAGNDEWVGIDDIQVLNSALVPTPVDLIYFTVKKENNCNTLRWTTITESNNTGFEVQRAEDGMNYRGIGFINTLAPNGNSNTRLDYRFTDSNFSVKQYYRLRQVDADGRSKFSAVVFVSRISQPALTIDRIFPNPAHEWLKVIIDAPVSGPADMVITDLSGRIIQRAIIMAESGSNTVWVDISRLSAGTYFVKLIDNNGVNTIKKFLKQ